MEVFRFKKFAVRNEISAMKVNTDGVLLGALTTLRAGDRRLLDVGTGTGTVALMAAQRLSEMTAGGSAGESCGEVSLREIQITGIDIDGASAAEAAQNFSLSPWAESLSARHISLDEFDRECGGGEFDVILSNPPYFESSLKAPDERRRAARHAETMSWRDVVEFAARRLRSAEARENEAGSRARDNGEGGRLSMIIPYESETEAVRYAASYGLRLFRRVGVRTTPRRPFSRSVLEFARDGAGTGTGTAISGSETNPCAGLSGGGIDDAGLTIQDAGGYTDEYRSLMSGFLMI